MIKSEPVESAVQRSIQTMMEWGDISQAEFNHYFNYVNLNRAVHDIRNGKISPWILFSSNNARKCIDSMPPSILPLIANSMDIDFWQRKVSLNKKDVAWINEVIG